MQVRGMRRAELTFELSDSSRCIPEEGRQTCVDYSFIIYITSDGPMGDKFKVSLDELEKRSRAPKGDPQLREINLMRVCIDRSWFPDFVSQVLSLLAFTGTKVQILTPEARPDFVTQNLPPDCVKVQYPGFPQQVSWIQSAVSWIQCVVSWNQSAVSWIPPFLTTQDRTREEVS